LTGLHADYFALFSSILLLYEHPLLLDFVFVIAWFRFKLKDQWGYVKYVFDSNHIKVHILSPEGAVMNVIVW